MKKGLRILLPMDLFWIFVVFNLNVMINCQFPCDPARYTFGATRNMIDYAVNHADVAARPAAVDNPTTTVLLRQQSGFIGKSKCCGMVDKWIGMFWSTENITFQVWRKDPNAVEDYMLVGAYEYTPLNTSKVEEEFRPDTDIYIRQNDLIGWTGNSLWKADTAFNTLFAHGVSLLKEENLNPQLGTTYTINTIHPALDFGTRGYAIKMIPKTRTGPSCQISLLQANVQDTISVGTVVGSVIGRTPDTFGTVTLSLSSKATELSLNTANGEITTSSNITVSAPPQRFLTVKVLVNDDCATEGTCTATLTVDFTNQPIEIVSLPDSATLIESTLIETTLHTVRTYDMNRNMITDEPRCDVNRTDPVNGSFSIRRGIASTFTLILDANPRLDYDVSSRHIVYVRCSDHYGSSDERPFTLYLTPNQAPIVNNSVNGEISTIINAKTTNGGDVVVHLLITDDENDNVILTFRKLDPNSPFDFDQISREVRASKALRDEENSLHVFIVTVADAYNAPYPVNIQIHLTGINSRPVFNNCPKTVQIPETASGGTVLYDVGATDSNYVLDNQQFSFRLSTIAPPTLRQLFNVDIASGVIKLGGMIDYETFREQFNETTIILNVTVSDGVHDARVDCVLTCDVMDVNEPPMFKKRTFTSSFNESEAPIYLDNIVFEFTDADMNDQHHFQIAYGDPGGFLNIDEQTGNLSLVKSCDIEADCPKHFNLTIAVVDRGGLQDIAAVHLVVLDINDNAPIFSGSSHDVVVTNLTTVGSMLISLNATDADDGINAHVTYFVAGIGLGSTYFDINEGGILLLKKKIDHRDDVSYIITVCAIDSGIPPLQGCTNVNIIYPKWTTLATHTTTKPPPCFLCVPGGVVLMTIMSCIGFGILTAILFLMRNRLRLPRIDVRWWIRPWATESHRADSALCDSEAHRCIHHLAQGFANNFIKELRITDPESLKNFIRIPEHFWMKKRLFTPVVRPQRRPRMQPTRRQIELRKREREKEREKLPTPEPDILTIPMEEYRRKPRKLPVFEEEEPVKFNFWQDGKDEDYLQPLGKKK